MTAGQAIRGAAALLIGAAAIALGTQPAAKAGLAEALDRARVAIADLSTDVAPGPLTELSAPGLAPRRLAAASYEPPSDLFAAHDLTVAGQARRWWSLPSADGPADRPVLVLLHGSGRDGRAMLDMWRGLDGAPLLVAPDSLDPTGWSWAADGPAFLDAVLAEAQRLHGYDPARVYLFGHSAGAMHALRLANRGGPWRAAAVHAGAVRPGELRPRPGAVPLRLYAGTEDVTVPLDLVRASAAALAGAGHPTDLVTIPGHDHWYYAIGPRLAREAWAFLVAQ